MVLGSLILGLLIDLESQAVESCTLNGKEAMEGPGHSERRQECGAVTVDINVLANSATP